MQEAPALLLLASTLRQFFAFFCPKIRSQFCLFFPHFAPIFEIQIHTITRKYFISGYILGCLGLKMGRWWKTKVSFNIRSLDLPQLITYVKQLSRYASPHEPKWSKGDPESIFTLLTHREQLYQWNFVIQLQILELVFRQTEYSNMDG